jgi:hypothetical protein
MPIMLSFNFLNDLFINSVRPPLMNDEGDNPMAQMPFPSSISFLFFTLVDFKPVKGARGQ